MKHIQEPSLLIAKSRFMVSFFPMQDLFETKQIENSPETDEEKFKTIRKRHTVLTENQEDDISKYEYHVFKFSRIQSWIRKWSQDVKSGTSPKISSLVHQ